MARAEESLMRRIHHIVLLVGLAALSPALTGCENFDMDKLDVFGLNEKKKLPGERKAVFPQGVPGVTQGIPQDLVKGNQPAPDAAQTPGAEPANAAAAAAPDDKSARAGQTGARAGWWPAADSALAGREPATAGAIARTGTEFRHCALAIVAGARHPLALMRSTSCTR